MDDEAQFAFQQYFALTEYDHLVNTSAIPDLPSEIRAAFSAEGVDTTQMWFPFQQLMLIADNHDAFLIDLSSGSVTPRHGTGNGDWMGLVTGVDGIEREVRFHLVRDGEGAWLVHQIQIAGGDPSWIPWSVPSA